MPDREACLLDSNILLRISNSDDLQHAIIVQALRELVRQGVRLHLSDAGRILECVDPSGR